MKSLVEAFLPLYETTAYALGCLVRGPQHAYALGQNIREVSGGVLDVAQGDLINTLHRLQQKGLIKQTELPGPTRRKPYALTDLGRDVLVADTRRLLMRIHYINEIDERQKNK